MAKRICSVFLAAILMFPLLSVCMADAHAAAGGKCGDYLTWMLRCDGTLLIEGTGGMFGYGEGADMPPAPWKAQRAKIRAVVLGEGVTSIGNYAFFGCAALKSVTLSKIVTYIGEHAFDGCAALADVNFYGTQAQWDAIDLSNYNAPLESAGIHCSICGSCGTSATWTLLFDGTLLIEGTGNMEDYTVDEEISDYAPWYDYRGAITAVIFGKEITSVGQCAFYGCTALKSAVILGQLSEIVNDAFHGCSALERMTFLRDVGEVGNNAFQNCAALADIYYSGTQTEWDAIEVGEVNDPWKNAAVHFNSCGFCGMNAYWTFLADGTLLIDGTGDMEDYYVNEVDEDYDYAPWYSHYDEITAVVVGRKVTNIGQCAFTNCTTVESVTVHGCLTEVVNDAFSGCSSLRYVTFLRNVGTIKNNAFHRCTALADVYYCGTEAQWSKIDIGEANAPLKSAKIHYGSCGPISLCLSLDGSVLTYAVANAPVDAILIASRYDASGRLTNVQAVTLASSNASGSFMMRGSGGTFRLMLVDEVTFAPLCEALLNE